MRFFNRNRVAVRVDVPLAASNTPNAGHGPVVDVSESRDFRRGDGIDRDGLCHAAPDRSSDLLRPLFLAYQVQPRRWQYTREPLQLHGGELQQDRCRCWPAV